MCRFAMAVCLASLLAGGALAEVTYFSESLSSSINLLERWNPDGSYGLQLEGTWTRVDSAGNAWDSGGFDPVFLTRLVYYTATGSGARFDRDDTDDGNANRWIEVTFTFPDAVIVDRFVTSWRGDANHCATNYQWLDDKGRVLVNASSPDRFAGDSYREDPSLLGSVETQSLTFKMYLEDNHKKPGSDPNFYHMAELLGLGAYLTPNIGQQLAMDGYNIFNTETNVTGNFDPRWTDHRFGDVGGKPGDIGSLPGGAGSCEWAFLREYVLDGMIMTMYNDGRRIFDLMLEVSDDGEDWTEIWSDAAFLYDANNPYISFAPGTTANYLRMSWGANSYVELTEFQLFGRPVPEPVTLTLLALGGLALLRRRR